MKCDCDWCPQIPDNWRQVRMKDIGILKSGDTFTAEQLYDNAQYPVYGGNGLRGYTDKYNKDGDYVLIGRQGALCGNINYAHGKFFATEHALVLNTFHNEYTTWLGETLRCANYNRLSQSAAQPGLAASVLMNQFIPYPPKEVRKRISSFIDSETSKIDHAIEILEKKRDAYSRLKASVINRAVTRGLNPNVKLKDSGLDWIGKIPEEWEIKRFKEVFSKHTTGFTPDSKNVANFDGNNTWVTIADMITKSVSESSLCLSDRAIAKAQQPITKKGSLLFSFKLSIGKVAFAAKDLYTNEAIVSLKPSKKYSLDFFYYYLPIVCFNNATENIYGAKMLNQKIIANMSFALPPVTEQRAIADYLDAECSKIDRADAIVTKQIDAYKRLKRSLINEVVTGKRAV